MKTVQNCQGHMGLLCFTLLSGHIPLITCLLLWPHTLIITPQACLEMTRHTAALFKSLSSSFFYLFLVTAHQMLLDIGTTAGEASHIQLHLQRLLIVGKASWQVGSLMTCPVLQGEAEICCLLHTNNCISQWSGACMSSNVIHSQVLQVNYKLIWLSMFLKWWQTYSR